MIGTAQIGAAALPMAMLLLIACYAVGSWLAVLLAKKHGVQLEAPLLLSLLFGLLAARLTFVVQFHADYLRNPLDIIDIRDGGWNLYAGWCAAWGCTLWQAFRERPKRRYLLMSLTVASAIWLSGALLLSSSASEKPQLPVISLPTLSGDNIALESSQGKPTVINLWAAWCPPCRREMPVLHEAQMAHPEIRFLYLNQGESAVVVRQFLQQQQLPLPHVLLDRQQQIAEIFKQRALPTTLFFDGQGKLTDMRLGELSRATLAQYLNHLSLPCKENQSCPSHYFQRNVLSSQ